jgi:hypothetical protein
MSTINDFIGSNEEIKYIATYNVTKRTDNPTNDEYTGSSGFSTDIAGVCGFSFIQNTYNYNSTGLVGAPRYVYEVYSLSSVSETNQEYLGNCTWQSSYPDVGVIGITQTPIFLFGVSSGTGIYSSLTKVVIDFTNVNRIVYLIGPKS